MATQRHRSDRFVLSPIRVRHLLDRHREPNVNQFRLNVTVRNQGNFCVWEQCDA